VTPFFFYFRERVWLIFSVPSRPTAFFPRGDRRVFLTVVAREKSSPLSRTSSVSPPFSSGNEEEPAYVSYLLPPHGERAPPFLFFLIAAPFFLSTVTSFLAWGS